MTWQDRILQEKSLFQVYNKSRLICSRNSNIYVAVGIFSLTISSFAALTHVAGHEFSGLSIESSIKQIAGIGFSFATAILGFLITGFAIFAGVTSRGVFVTLAKLDHPGSTVTRLQFMFFNFLFVFIHYLAFLFVSLVLLVILDSHGPFYLYFYPLSNINILSINLFCFFLSAIYGWFTFILMLLKSFIWNIYQSILLSIVLDKLDQHGSE